MRRSGRSGLADLGALAAGAVIGAAVGEVAYRLLLRGDDPEKDEPLGSGSGELFDVTSFDGTTIAAESWGDPQASPIILSHGVTLGRGVWHYQVRDLADRFRLVTYDARGHGASGPSRGPAGTTIPTAEALARDLLAVIEASGSRPCVVVGHSMGGMTTLQLVNDHAGQVAGVVKGLVLLNTTFTASVRRSLETIGRRRRRVRGGLVGGVGSALDRTGAISRGLGYLRVPHNDLALLAMRLGFGARPSRSHLVLTHRLMSATSAETISAALPGLRDFVLLRALEKIDAPVLIVSGDRDLITPTELSERMAESIPGAELVVYPGAGHMVMLERYREFNEALCKFASVVLS
jgi:pimeloyl-ACP methyl ester carboxylesterase